MPKATVRRSKPDALDVQVAELSKSITKRVALTRAKLPGATATQLAQTYVNVRQACEMLNAMATPIIELLGEINAKLPEAFDAEGQTSVTLDIGYRIQVADALRCSIKGDQREAALKYLKSRKDLRALVIETVNAGTLAATARHLAEQGVDLPEAFFHTFIQRVVSMNKVAPSKKKAA